MERVEKFEKLLERLALKTGMSEGGKAWLKCAIDPFHDGPLSVPGYPDMSTGSSIVQCVKVSRTITVSPTTYPGGADVTVRFENLLYMQPTYPYTIDNRGVITGLAQIGTNSYYGGVVAKIGAPGTDLSANSNFVITQLTPNFVKRRLRLIAAGFEVHNVTPQLYVGGSVTTFRQAQSSNDFTMQTRYSNIASHNKVDVVQAAPSTETNALLLAGSHTWDALAGCYCVATMQTNENPAVYPTPLSVIESTQYDTRAKSFDDGGATSIFEAGKYFVGLEPWPIGGPLVPALMVPTCLNAIVPFNSVGAYFTGLPANTVLKINANFWIERFPSELDGDLTVLATPSASFDPIALEAYARIIKSMPVGVPVAENGFGDWFAGCIASVIDGLIGAPISRNLLSSADTYFNRSTNQGESSPYSNSNTQIKRMQSKAEIKAKQYRKQRLLNRAENDRKFVGPQRQMKQLASNVNKLQAKQNYNEKP